MSKSSPPTKPSGVPESQPRLAKGEQAVAEKAEPKINFYPPWAPRCWNGMRWGEFFRLLSEGRFRVHPSRIPSLLPITGCSIASSALTVIDRWRYRKKIRETRLEKPPIFIVGHWRTGTTLLHELMALDENFTFPTTLDCFTPHHFLTSHWFLHGLVKLLLPGRRPMDNMKLGIDHPQECDFALAALGVPTPYRRIAFPNQNDNFLRLLSMDTMEADEQFQIREALTEFYQALTWRQPKQLVLKSPPHTARISKLNEWFPGARFIHLSRDPNSVVPSTMHLWKSMDYLHGFQTPKYSRTELLSIVMGAFETMYESYFGERDQIDSDNLVELRFEEFVDRPLESLQGLYSQLGFDGFADARPRFEESLNKRHSHRMNPKSVDHDVEKAVAHRLVRYSEEFGYQL